MSNARTLIHTTVIALLQATLPDALIDSRMRGYSDTARPCINVNIIEERTVDGSQMTPPILTKEAKLVVIAFIEDGEELGDNRQAIDALADAIEASLPYTHEAWSDCSHTLTEFSAKPDGALGGRQP